MLCSSTDSGKRFSKQVDNVPASARSAQLMCNSFCGMADDNLPRALPDDQVSSDGSLHVCDNALYATGGEVKFEEGEVLYNEPEIVPAVLISPNKLYNTLKKKKSHSSLSTQKHKTASVPPYDESSYDQLHHNASRHQQRDVEKPVLLSANDQLNYEYLHY